MTWLGPVGPVEAAALAEHVVGGPTGAPPPEWWSSAAFVPADLFDDVPSSGRGTTA